MTKTEEATRVLEKCIGKNGMWASPHRYKHQCWTRDFVIAGMDWLLKNHRADLALLHLKNLAALQNPNGQIPIMFLDDTKEWLKIKIESSIRRGEISFLLNAFLSKEGVAGLSPWTRDSELLFILGVQKLLKHTNQEFVSGLYQKASLARLYLENNLLKDGLMFGVDWRDTRRDLDGKFLLSNNCLLYQTYSLLYGHENTAEALKFRIQEKFWTGLYFRDYPGTDDWDTLGNALAIISGVANYEQACLILQKTEEFNSLFGYKVNSTTLPFKNSKEEELMKKVNQYGIIWPFIHGFMILAALKTNSWESIDLAKRQFEKWNKLKGFFEWYDPETGEGYGSEDQMWSAALYLRCAEKIKNI